MEEWSNDTTKKAEKKENKGKKEMRYKVVLRAFCPCQRLPLFLNQERKKQDETVPEKKKENQVGWLLFYLDH